MSALVLIVEQLEAGDELDALLALYVMDWLMVSTAAPHDTWSRLNPESHIASPVMKVSEWHPSRDLVQAMRVLDACGKGLSEDGAGHVWGTAIRRRSSGPSEITLSENEMGPLKTVVGATLELAIARAAMAWALRREIRDEPRRDDRREPGGGPRVGDQPLS